MHYQHPSVSLGRELLSTLLVHIRLRGAEQVLHSIKSGGFLPMVVMLRLKLRLCGVLEVTAEACGWDGRDVQPTDEFHSLRLLLFEQMGCVRGGCVSRRACKTIGAIGTRTVMVVMCCSCF